MAVLAEGGKHTSACPQISNPCELAQIRRHEKEGKGVMEEEEKEGREKKKKKKNTKFPANVSCSGS